MAKMRVRIQKVGNKEPLLLKKGFWGLSTSLLLARIIKKFY